MINGFKALLICSLSVATLGIVFGGLAYSHEPHALAMFGLGGAFIGAVMAIEFEPGYFKPPILWKTLFSATGCLLFAHSIEASTNGYILAIIIGVFLGLTASFWLKHVTFP